MVDFLFPLIKLFRYLLLFRSYEAKCVQLGSFRRGLTYCTQILPGHGRPPSNILGTIRLQTLGYPTVKTASPAFPRFHTIPDRRTDGYAVDTALAELALRRAVKRMLRD